MANRLKEKLLGNGDFLYSMEMVTGRGLAEKDLSVLTNEAKEASEYGKIDVLSFTDNPGGNTRLMPDYFAGLQQKEGGPAALVHVACKDYNRAALESRLFQLWQMGIRNVLALTGDYPTAVYHGVAKPVFDIDSVNLLELISALNHGLPLPGRRPGIESRLPATDFCAGAVVSPFKRDEAELLSQYMKLRYKIERGAQFIYTQVGYNARKFDELVRYTRDNHLDRPLIGNVYVLHPVVSRLMFENQLPGCVVSAPLYAKVKEWATGEDKGKSRFLEFAAKQVAVLHGLGYRGAHIGGFGLKFKEVVQIIEQSEAMASSWRDFLPELMFEDRSEFYLYEKDPATGLNTQAVNPALTRKPGKEWTHRFMRIVHGLIFSGRSPFFKPSVSVSRLLDKKPGPARTLDSLEHTAKFFSNGCHHCGDCTLPKTTYLCPEEHCAKYLRNGPCGGGYHGKCEVFKHRDCFWVRIYNRRKGYGETSQGETHRLPPRNWALYHTSSWINFFTGKDNQKLTA